LSEPAAGQMALERSRTYRLSGPASTSIEGFAQKSGFSHHRDTENSLCLCGDEIHSFALTPCQSFGRKPHDDVPEGRPIEPERFLLEVHVAVSNRYVSGMLRTEMDWSTQPHGVVRRPIGQLMYDGRTFDGRTQNDAY